MENIFCGLQFLAFFDALTFLVPLLEIFTVKISISGEWGKELLVLASSTIPSSVSSRTMVAGSTKLTLASLFRSLGINGFNELETSNFAFFVLFGVETRDFDKVEIPIEDRFLFMAFCLILAADRRSGVDLTFWTLLNFGVFAASFYNKTR